MNIQRFTAPTAREALAKARMAFGEGTLILSNRPTAQGVEVVATGEEALQALDRGEGLSPRSPSPRSEPLASRAERNAPRPSRATAQASAIDDANQLSMSTLSFQDYVRERMLRRRQEGLTPAASASGAARNAASMPSHAPSAVPAQRAARPQAPSPALSPATARPASLRITPFPSAAAAEGSPAAQVPTLNGLDLSAPSAPNGVMSELQAMRSLIEERFTTLAWLGQARQNPIHTHLLLKLIRAGYSPALARTILERMPEDATAAEAMRWVMDTLTRNLRADAAEPAIEQLGGVFALVGSTGVGKTTTAAKLAGLCAREHGAHSVGLITLDTYRVGAHEQLRAFGRMLGVVAHLAHDRAALQDLLGLLANKKMVLIDTSGVAPNDPRKREMLDLLDLPGVQRLLVLNAGGHGDTLDGMIEAFSSGAGQASILSKTDEAAKIAPALDAAIRHQLVLRGITNGQKVPEDWQRADAAALVAQSMRAPGRSAFDPSSADLNFFFAQSAPLAVQPLQAGHA